MSSEVPCSTQKHSPLTLVSMVGKIIVRAGLGLKVSGYEESQSLEDSIQIVKQASLRGASFVRTLLQHWRGFSNDSMPLSCFAGFADCGALLSQTCRQHTHGINGKGGDVAALALVTLNAFSVVSGCFGVWFGNPRNFLMTLISSGICVEGATVPSSLTHLRQIHGKDSRRTHGSSLLCLLSSPNQDDCSSQA